MTVLSNVEADPTVQFEPHAWMGLVLDHFAKGEQAIGQLALALDLPISNGSLGSLTELRRRLVASDNRKARTLEK